MVRNVAPDTGDVVPDLLDGRRQLRLTASSDEHVRAFADKLLRRRLPNPATGTRYERDLAVELSHVVEPPV